MSTIFCPFINGKCNVSCVFNNGGYDDNDKDNCDLLGAAHVISSYETVKLPEEYLKNIENGINTILLNTGTDQTESYNIKRLLEDIKQKITKD